MAAPRPSPRSAAPVTASIALGGLLLLLAGACKSEQARVPPPAPAKAEAPSPPAAAKEERAPEDTAGSQLQGTLRGKPFTVRSAMSGVVFGGAGGAVQMIILSDSPEACAQLGRNEKSKHARRLHLQLSEKGEEGEYTEPESSGTFSIDGEEQRAFAWYTEDDERCEEALNVEAMGGEVTLGEGEATGSFSLELKGGERISGKFQAPKCAALSQGYGSMKEQAERPAPTCR